MPASSYLQVIIRNFRVCSNSHVPLLMNRILSNQNVFLRRFSPKVYVKIRRLHLSPEGGMHNEEDSLKKDSRTRGYYLNTISQYPVVVHLKDLDEHMRIRGYSALRWGLALIMLAGFGLYYFREPVKEKLSEEVSDVASRSLGDQNVVMKANEVTRAVLYEIMNDPETLSLAVNFVAQILRSEAVVQTAADLSLQVIADQQIRTYVALLANQTVKSLLEMEDLRQHLQSYITSLLLDENTRNGCVQLLKMLVSIPEVQHVLEDLAGEVIKGDIVSNYVTNMGKSAALKVVNDLKVQEQTGQALWNAAKFAVTPSWLYSQQDVD